MASFTFLWWHYRLTPSYPTSWCCLHNCRSYHWYCGSLL